MSESNLKPTEVNGKSPIDFSNICIISPRTGKT